MQMNHEIRVKETFRQAIIKAADKGEEVKNMIQTLTQEVLNSEMNATGLTREKVKSLVRDAMEGVIQGAKETREKTDDLTRRAVDGIIEAVRQISGTTKIKTRDYLKQATLGIQTAVHQAGDLIIESVSSALENIMELKLKARITFKCQAGDASRVHLVGSFNHWNPNATPLKKTLKGHWSVTLTLPYGKYEYRYLIDDQWFTDPDTPHVTNEFGSENSVIIVGY